MAKDVRLKGLLANSSQLPTMPTVASQLLSISDWDDIDLGKIAEIISKDVSLVTKVLRMVNSPYYGLAYKISMVSQALVVLGARATKSLCLSFSLLKMTSKNKSSSFDYSGFWTRSVNTAVAAREFALLAGLKNAEEAFLSGLLQDIGVLIFGHYAQEEYALMALMADDKLAPPLELERQFFGMDHVEMAKSLFEEWKLPVSLLIPVLYHHEPESVSQTDPQTLLAIHIQYFAGRVGEWLYSTQKSSESLEKLRDYAALYFGIHPVEFDNLMRRIDDRMSEVTELFELTQPRPTTYAKLLERANVALGGIVNEQERLLRELEAAKLEAKTLTEQLRKANLKLLNESRKDALTGLANRRHFDEFVRSELERSFRHGHSIALLFIDIDDFKTINDRYGHLSGDAMLKQFAQILRSSVRENDAVARYGGEEFLIVLVETAVSGAIVVAERIRRMIARTPFFSSDNRVPNYVTASIGIATWTAKDSRIDAEALIERADYAMYRAKKAGKNCISIAEIPQAIPKVTLHLGEQKI